MSSRGWKHWIQVGKKEDTQEAELSVNQNTESNQEGGLSVQDSVTVGLQGWGRTGEVLRRLVCSQTVHTVAEEHCRPDDVRHSGPCPLPPPCP